MFVRSIKDNNTDIFEKESKSLMNLKADRIIKAIELCVTLANTIINLTNAS